MRSFGKSICSTPSLSKEGLSLSFAKSRASSSVCIVINIAAQSCEIAHTAAPWSTVVLPPCTQHWQVISRFLLSPNSFKGSFSHGVKSARNLFPCGEPFKNKNFSSHFQIGSRDFSLMYFRQFIPRKSSPSSHQKRLSFSFLFHAERFRQHQLKAKLGSRKLQP